MGQPHKWAEVIKAWADGAEIEFKNVYDEWVPLINPFWDNTHEYRIKPQPQYLYVFANGIETLVSVDEGKYYKDLPLIGKIKLETEDE